MLIFGLWHGATLTFLLWGAYHGALLVIHRILQQLQRSMGITMNGPLMNTIPWLCTFLSISLGWVAFRAESSAQVMAMVRAIFSPSGYWKRHLPIGFYLAVAGLAGGYFAYHAAAKAVRFLLEGRSLSAPQPETGAVWRMVHLLSENSWMWVTPSLAVLAILTALIIGQRVDVDANPFVYARF
jgi:alginate O-acetyltransferase complex protein AlgI